MFERSSAATAEPGPSLYGGSLVRLRDSKGLGYLATLLEKPGREFHVMDLGAQGHGGSPRLRWRVDGGPIATS